jgi:hypothetical protein
MTQVKGVIQLMGTLDGYCYYRINGKDVVRRVGTVSKAHREKAPSNARVRPTMQEFAGASVIGAALRHALNPFAKEMSDSYAYGRLNATLKKLLALGSGEPGKRRFDAAAHGKALRGFEFNAHCALGDLVKGPVTVRHDRATHAVEAKLPALNGDTLSRIPEGATHAAWVLAVAPLGSYAYDEKRKAYVCEVPNATPTGDRVQTTVTALSEGPPPTLLRASLGNGEALPAGCALVVCAGVRFFTMVHGRPVPLKRHGALKVMEVLMM